MKTIKYLRESIRELSESLDHVTLSQQKLIVERMFHLTDPDDPADLALLATNIQRMIDRDIAELDVLESPPDPYAQSVFELDRIIDQRSAELELELEQSAERQHERHVAPVPTSKMESN